MRRVKRIVGPGLLCLAAAGCPNPCSPSYDVRYDRPDANRLKELSAALDLYFLRCERYPADLAGLTRSVPGRIDAILAEIPTDSWGREYVYVHETGPEREGYRLFSRGPDGVAGTDDDVTLP